jgi:hypothetical protein
VYSQPFQQFPHFFDLVSLGLLARMGAMSPPLLTSEFYLYPGSRPLHNFCPKCLEQSLDICEDD